MEDPRGERMSGEGNRFIFVEKVGGEKGEGGSSAFSSAIKAIVGYSARSTTREEKFFLFDANRVYIYIYIYVNASGTARLL